MYLYFFVFVNFVCKSRPRPCNYLSVNTFQTQEDKLSAARNELNKLRQQETELEKEVSNTYMFSRDDCLKMAFVMTRNIHNH